MRTPVPTSGHSPLLRKSNCAANILVSSWEFGIFSSGFCGGCPKLFVH